MNYPGGATQGYRYSLAISSWFQEYPQFAEIPPNTRSWPAKCLEHEAEIRAWRALRDEEVRRDHRGIPETLRYHYPETVFKRWYEATGDPEEVEERRRQRGARIADLRATVEQLQNENERQRVELREAYGGEDGGPRIRRVSQPQSIAQAIFRWVPLRKRRRVIEWQIRLLVEQEGPQVIEELVRRVSEPPEPSHQEPPPLLEPPARPRMVRRAPIPPEEETMH